MTLKMGLWSIYLIGVIAGYCIWPIFGVYSVLQNEDRLHCLLPADAVGTACQLQRRERCPRREWRLQASRGLILEVHVPYEPNEP